MKIYIVKSLLFILFLLFQGCSLKNNVERISIKDAIAPKNLDYDKVYTSLLTQYKNWQGVKYKYGGYSRKGIDCSAFVQKTFNDKLNFYLPRTTKLQLKLGQEIETKALLPGDLIFFKTGFKTNHVGIYLKKGKFMHVSTKKGVIISKLNNPYYIKHLWKIKRVLY